MLGLNPSLKGSSHKAITNINIPVQVIDIESHIGDRLEGIKEVVDLECFGRYWHHLGLNWHKMELWSIKIIVIGWIMVNLAELVDWLIRI